MSSLFYFLSFLLEIYKVYWSFQRTKFLFIDSLFLVSLISVFYFFPFLICVYFALCFLISCVEEFNIFITHFFLRSIFSRSLVLSWGNFATQQHLVIYGTIFDWHNWRRWCYWHLVGRGQGCC